MLPTVYHTKFTIIYMKSKKVVEKLILESILLEELKSKQQ